MIEPPSGRGSVSAKATRYFLMAHRAGVIDEIR
jgi:hypothetical protein